MTPAQAAQAFAATLVDQLARMGVRHASISPGSRSAPLAMAIARHGGIRVFMHVDERAGSFFGLGLARATGVPVILLCTSGTATAEFHAAVIEAHHSRVPLIVLTADRPPELVGVGANQAIDQARIYSGAVRWYADPGVPAWSPGAPRAWRRLAVRAVAEAAGPPAGPVHLNLPFRDPLTPPPGAPPSPAGEPPPGRVWPGRAAEPTAEEIEAVRSALAGARRPLLVAGEMARGRDLLSAVGEFCAAAGTPVLAEPSSGLRVRGLGPLVDAYEGLLRHRQWLDRHDPDLVLRLGATPTSRPLNEWLERTGAPTILLDSGGGWRDPDAAAGHILRCDEGALLRAASRGLLARPRAWIEGWAGAGAVARTAIDASLEAAPLYEAHAVRALARALPAQAALMVGSSMPIRDVDSFWPAASPGQRFFGNRGASGIDGLVSTGLGVAAAGDLPAALLLGDLSLYHDMNGLWAVRRHALKPVIVVLDNDGGGIFSFLPQAAHEDVFEELFGTPLGVDLEQAGRLYGLRTEVVRGAEAIEPAIRAAFDSGVASMVLVRFTRSGSVAGHRSAWAAVAAALRA